MPEYDFRCYGRFYEQLERCRKCKIKRHCSKAADPPLLDRRDLPDGVKEVVYNKLLPSSSNRYAEAEADRRFTRADLLEVIVFMAALDVRSLDLIMQKLDMPELRFTELAQKRKVTRQAVHKMIKQRLARIPELAAVLTFRRHKNTGALPAQQPSFMEEVCRIRRQTRENRLKKPKLASNFLRNLRYSKPSLLSSPMSILKGASIWRKESTP